MDEDVYFDGDPAHDSRRRHLERVIKGGPPPRRWPWVVLAAGGGAWAFWRLIQKPAAARTADAPGEPKGR